MPEEVSAVVNMQVAGARRRWLRMGFWACIVIAVAAVIRRLLALAYPQHSGAPPMATLDQVFASHAALTLAHILPALVFVLISPFFVLHDSNKRALLEWLLYPLGLAVGITAYAMSVNAVGGWLERSAVLLFNTIFLFSLCRAYLYMRQGQFRMERRWMIRGIAILLGVATTRPVMGIFFATSRLTHLGPSQFFGIAFWIGFSINAVAVELWLRNEDQNQERRETLNVSQSI